MTKFVVPAGHALVRLDDLAALIANQAPPQAPAVTGVSQANRAGLAEAVALVAAKVHGIDSPGLSGDVTPAAVTESMAMLASVFLRHLLPRDQGAELLTDLGILAARESEP